MPRYRRPKEDEDSSGDYKFQHFGNNRYVCDVFEDMRKCAETQNYSMMRGLIEEGQIMANRMESALSDRKDLIELTSEMSKARKAYKALKKEYSELLKMTKALRPPTLNKE